MSGSGNMMPTSRTRIRPFTSMQAQLRPISPSPPRKTMRMASCDPAPPALLDPLVGARPEALVGAPVDALADALPDRFVGALADALPETLGGAPSLAEPEPLPGSLLWRSFLTEAFLFVPAPPGRPPDRPVRSGSGNR